MAGQVPLGRYGIGDMAAVGSWRSGARAAGHTRMGSPPSRRERGDRVRVQRSHPTPALLARNARDAVDRVDGVVRVRALRWDRLLGIPCNMILADLTAAYPDPTYRLGRERPQRPDASNALYRSFRAGLIVLDVEAALVGLSLSARKRTIQAGFPIQRAALLLCSNPFTAVKHVIVFCLISTVNLCLIASGSHPGARTATRIQIQGGPGRWMLQPGV